MKHTLPATFLLLMMSLLLMPAGLSAHGLAVTIPAHESMLREAPTTLRLQFGEPMTILALELHPLDREDSREPVTVTLPRNSIGQSTAFGERITLPLPVLGPGTWRVSYQARTDEGHVRADDFTFTITP